MTDPAGLQSIGFDEVERLEPDTEALWEFALSDGSVVRGRMLHFDGQTMTVETAFGPLTLPSTSVALIRSRIGVEADQDGLVLFTNGDRLTATLSQATETSWVFGFSKGQLVVEVPEAIALVVLATPPAAVSLPELQAGTRAATAPLPRIVRWIGVPKPEKIDPRPRIPNIGLAPDGSSVVFVTRYSDYVYFNTIDLRSGEQKRSEYYRCETGLGIVLVRALEDETLARVPEDETFVYRCGWRVHFQPRREISVTRELNSDASATLPGSGVNSSGQIEHS